MNYYEIISILIPFLLIGAIFIHKIALGRKKRRTQIGVEQQPSQVQTIHEPTRVEELHYPWQETQIYTNQLEMNYNFINDPPPPYGSIRPANQLYLDPHNDLNTGQSKLMNQSNVNIR